MIKSDFTTMIGPFRVNNVMEWEKINEDRTIVGFDLPKWENKKIGVTIVQTADNWSHIKNVGNYVYYRQVEKFPMLNTKEKITRVPLNVRRLIDGTTRKYIDCSQEEVFNPKLKTFKILKLQLKRKVIKISKFLFDKSRINERISKINHEIIKLRWLKK